MILSNKYKEKNQQNEIANYFSSYLDDANTGLELFFFLGMKPRIFFALFSVFFLYWSQNHEFRSLATCG